MRLPVVVDLLSRDGSVSKDAKLTNAFVEADDVVKRPGVLSVGSAGSGTAQHLSNKNTAVVGDYFKVFHITNGVITVDSSTAISPIATGKMFNSEKSGETAQTMLLKNEKQAWIYTP